MTIFITGGTGTVGSDVVRILAERGEKPRVLVRSEEKRAKLPRGAEGAIGDFHDRQSLEQGMKGMEKLFLLTPLSETEEREGLNAVDAAKAVGIRHIVYMTIHRVREVPEAPHFASKIAIQDAIEKSGIAWTEIMPNNFYQNDFWFKQGIVEYNVYAQPIGDIGLSRVDTRDIAEAVVNALTGKGHEGKRYAIVGPEGWTGTATAGVWSRALGREIRYAGNDLDAWASEARKMLPEFLVADFKIMYAFFQRNGLLASASDLAETEAIVGHKPRGFEAYAHETAAAWNR